MIIQAGYDLSCKDYIAGVYLDSENEDEECDKPPITSGSEMTQMGGTKDLFSLAAVRFLHGGKLTDLVTI